jgi:hypothetical protein
MFGFGFDDPKQVYQTRGDSTRSCRELSHHLLDGRLDLLRAAHRG